MSDFDAGFKGHGFVLFEHWENGRSLLEVSSSPRGMTLEPGDTIIRRVWSAAGHPEVYNSAKEETK